MDLALSALPYLAVPGVVFGIYIAHRKLRISGYSGIPLFGPMLEKTLGAALIGAGFHDDILEPAPPPAPVKVEPTNLPPAPPVPPPAPVPAQPSAPAPAPAEPSATDPLLAVWKKYQPDEEPETGIGYGPGYGPHNKPGYDHMQNIHRRKMWNPFTVAPGDPPQPDAEEPNEDMDNRPRKDATKPSKKGSKKRKSSKKGSSRDDSLSPRSRGSGRSRTAEDEPNEGEEIEAGSLDRERLATKKRKKKRKGGSQRETKKGSKKRKRKTSKKGSKKGSRKGKGSKKGSKKDKESPNSSKKRSKKSSKKDKASPDNSKKRSKKSSKKKRSKKGSDKEKDKEDKE